MIYQFTVIICGLILCTFNSLAVSTEDSHRIDDPIFTQNSLYDDEEFEMDRYSRLKNSPTIRTNYGDVQGRIELFRDKEVAVFHGIRYAKPPVGNLRFKTPAPVDSGTIAKFGLQTTENVACVQPKNFLLPETLTVKEDCLFLNIWVPLSKESTDDNSSPLPVMFWVHGGSFHLGSANQLDYNGIVLSALGQVIVVSINYRLGFFGFLNAESEFAAGNMGLYDQVAALSWVSENINRFGGDPDRITVFGESAGGLAVGLLTVSPLSRHLFQQAIIQSGSPYSPIRPEPRSKVFEKSLTFSKAINCSHPNDVEFTESAMACLMAADHKLIDDYGRSEKMHSQILGNPMFGDELIPTTVRDLMQNPANINQNLKVLVGFNKDEGFAFIVDQLEYLLDSYGLQSYEKDEINSLTSALLKGRPVDPLKLTSYYCENMTTKWDSDKVFETMLDLYGDVYINCPVYYLAKRFTEILGYENVFSYMLTKASSQAFMPVCDGRGRVCHADELFLIFGVPLRTPELFEDADVVLSEQLVQIWTDFAKTGKTKWINSNNNWFVDLPLEKLLKYHPKMTYACEALYETLFD